MLKLFRRLTLDDALILLILFTGALLRFYRLSEIPFTHDEFSAIIRTQFSTFHDLIEKGIKIDGHPAGVQVFLYYLVRAFGVSEITLKLPFILMGLVSVWLVYLIGKDWFNPAVGLVAASFVSFLQFPVMYSQIARPYASGLCFAMMMVYFWTKVIFHPQRKYYQNLAGYILSGVLCAYNHHFSLLVAGMIGVTGLFYCRREGIRSYILAGLTIIAAYLPHLPILVHQLGIGGVEGWLSKPRYDFLFDYMRYIFQFSVYIYALVLVLISLSFFRKNASPSVNKKFILISALWFLLPYIIGFCYSQWRSAVLQYSVLIFSFPFLLFVLFGFLKTDKPLHKILLVAVIGMTVIPSLVFERKHFSLFYKDVYREIVKESDHLADSLGADRCLVILDTKKEINRFYLSKPEYARLPFIYLQDIKGKGSLMNLLDSCKAQYLAFGSLSSTNSEFYPLMMERFPFLVRHKSYCGGDFYLFSRTEPPLFSNEYFYEKVNTFEPSLPEWSWVSEKQISDSLAISGKRSYANITGSEFSPSYIRSLRDMIHSENDVIDVSVDIRTPLVFPGAWLVLAVTSDGKVIKWNAASVNDYVRPGHEGRVFQSLRLSDIEFRHHRLMFNTYIWNPMKSHYILDDYRIKVRSGNPYLYGLYRKLGKRTS